jgi:hypothetical protein
MPRHHGHREQGGSRKGIIALTRNGRLTSPATSGIPDAPGLIGKLGSELRVKRVSESN